jgi:hypothetical protein
MKHSILLLIFYFIFFAVSVSAQEAIKVDEFENLPCDELGGRIHNVFAESAESKDSKIHIIIYQGKLLRPSYNFQNKTIYPRRNEVKAEIENIKSRISIFKLDKSRFVLIEGGFRERFTVEVWLVPNGAIAPKPTPTLKTMKYSKGKSSPCPPM